MRLASRVASAAGRRRSRPARSARPAPRRRGRLGAACGMLRAARRSRRHRGRRSWRCPGAGPRCGASPARAGRPPRYPLPWQLPRAAHRSCSAGRPPPAPRPGRPAAAAGRGCWPVLGQRRVVQPPSLAVKRGRDGLPAHVQAAEHLVATHRRVPFPPRSCAVASVRRQRPAATLAKRPATPGHVPISGPPAPPDPVTTPSGSSMTGATNHAGSSDHSPQLKGHLKITGWGAVRPASAALVRQ